MSPVPSSEPLPNPDEPQPTLVPFAVGDRVRLGLRPPYLKTADPMPMLRPPDTVALGDEGVILDCRPGGFWVVRFTPGCFLVDSKYLERVALFTASAADHTNIDEVAT
ncbi:regulatory protein SipA [Neosynechococcus sphagnicola]|uniref:regulatory protein SipA n=1 Tax=Neosynechococcus sphagnicola TaxID=1501145 RepID=UPI0009DD57C2|nr:DUF3148 domain-containing protein [Neosynechococcus sphagnicola]